MCVCCIKINKIIHCAKLCYWPKISEAFEVCELSEQNKNVKMHYFLFGRIFARIGNTGVNHNCKKLHTDGAINGQRKQKKKQTLHTLAFGLCTG